MLSSCFSVSTCMYLLFGAALYMLLREAKGYFLLLNKVAAFRLNHTCVERPHHLGERLSVSMAQKSITAFFKGPEKRKGTAESTEGAAKRQKARHFLVLAPCASLSTHDGKEQLKPLQGAGISHSRSSCVNRW